MSQGTSDPTITHVFTYTLVGQSRIHRGDHIPVIFCPYMLLSSTRKAVSATSVYFESLPYRVHPEMGYIDYEQLEHDAGLFKPAMIIAGGSAYPRDYDYKRFREIADVNGALLMMDMC